MLLLEVVEVVDMVLQEVIGNLLQDWGKNSRSGYRSGRWSGYWSGCRSGSLGKNLEMFDICARNAVSSILLRWETGNFVDLGYA